MASPPRQLLWPSLATWLLIATLAWAPPLGAAAADLTPTRQAWSLYYQGKALQARRGLEDYLGDPAGQASDDRLIVLETLLDICLQSLAEPCVAKYAPVYADLAGRRPFANDVQKIEAARRAGYYLFAAQAPQMSKEGLAAILANGNWTLDHPYDVGLYLRRRVLSANLNLRLGRVEAAERDIDKVLSLIASLDDANSIRPTVIWALSDIMETLLALGDTERAFGLLRASSARIGANLAPRSVETALFALRAGRVLDEIGRPGKAREFLDLAVATLDQIELDPEVRARLLAVALTSKANLCNAVDVACARDALARHPFRELHASADHAPGSFAEIQYLEARATTAALSGAPDPAVAAVLQRPLAFRPEPDEVEAIKVYQAMGRALASPAGEARSAALREVARQVRVLARQPREAPFGAWYRSGSFDQGVLRLTLAQAEAFKGEDGADLVFTLLQLVQRRGQTFDADALTVLGQARTALERRAVHQALRLRVRRDALEREKIAAVTGGFAAASATPRPKPDFAVRHRFRDYAARIDAASAGLSKAGLAVAGTNLVTLKQMQAVLGPNEAALMLAPSTGDALVYMCVRRDASLRRVVRADLATLRPDARLIQAALTAGHAPSEALDAQYPVAAATRLYDIFIRPFEPCLKPGDHILWLPDLSLTGFPLAALLEQAPPRLERGYDLSQAAWLARSHAGTYAGSAAVVVALRKAPAPPAAQFDFLGVGDPEFSGVTPGGEDRARIVTRGVRASAGGVSTLPALPETEDELRRSAAGFRNPRLLLEDAASEGGFRRELAGAYRYLSFATHGLIRDDLQGLSEPALALTPVSSASALDDGLLTAPEIADLNLSARFVALSACNTANFDIGQMAQDLPALASAFAVAGVPAVLGTLWPVDSTTGMEVVAGAFERLRAGRAPAEALAEAQRAFLAGPPSRAHLHPRFWAPFVVLGDGGLAAPTERPSAPLKVSLVEAPQGRGEILQVARGEGGRIVTQDRRSLSAWSAGLGLEPSSALVGSAPLDVRRTVFASRPLDAGGQATKLSVFIVEDGAAPRRLFDVETSRASRVTFARTGEAILIAYSMWTFVAPPTGPIFQDDFDQALCASQPSTRVEIRELATGALTAGTDVEGRYVNAAAVTSDGDVLLGGQAQASCGEGRASVLAIDKDLKTRDLYRDDSLGASEVRALAALPDGRFFVAASKDNTVEFRNPSGAVSAVGQEGVARALYGGMGFLIGADGRATDPLLLDAGTSLFVDAADASQPDDILLGGGIGDRPAIFRLSAALAH